MNMTNKDVEQALLKDSVERLWVFCKDLSARIDGAIFKRDIEPYTRLLITIIGAVSTAIILGILKLFVK